jgi:integrase
MIRRMRIKFTAKTIEHLSAQGPKRLDAYDTVLQGFGLRVSPTGRKVWFVIVRPEGRAKRVTIGGYPTLSLHDAREAAARLMRDGHPRGVTPDFPCGVSPTLGEIVPQFIQLYARPKNRRWRATERTLHKFEKLFTVPITEIKRTDVVRALDGLIASGMQVGANRALAGLKKLMNWALDRGIVPVNPIAGLKPPAVEVARERVLADHELAKLLAVADEEGYPFGPALKILALTAQRRGEVTGMKWSEVDLDRQTWTIPAARSKNKQSHCVPLTDEVRAILRAIPRFVGSDLVFTTTGITPISGFGRLKDRIAASLGASDWCIHDLRRTAASGMARLGIAPHIVEKVLNHKSGVISGVAAVYNRYGYDREKRDALERWANAIAQMSNDQNGLSSCLALLPENLGSLSERRAVILDENF